MSHYRLNNTSKYFLNSKGFRYCCKLSESEKENIYKKRFPVYKYFEFTLLEAEFTLNADSNDLIIDVMDVGGGRYAPYYFDEYGTYEPLLEIINKRIDRELKYIGATKNHDNRCRKRLFEMPISQNNKP